MCGRILLGGASACAVVGGMKVFRDNFGEKNFTVAFGYMMTIGLLGAVYGTNILSSIIMISGLEHLLHLLIFFGIILAGLTFFLLPSIKFVSGNNKDVKEDFIFVISNKKIIKISLIGGLMIGPLEGFADTWGAAFMMNVHGLDYKFSTTLCSMIFMGMAFGTATLPSIANKFEEKFGNDFGKPTNIFLLLSAVLLLCLFTFIISPFEYKTWQYYLLFITIGYFSGYQVFIFAKAAYYTRGRLSGFASSIANMIMMSFGEVYHSLIGIVTDEVWYGKLDIVGVKIYDASELVASMYPVEVSLFLALVWVFKVYLKEKRKVRLNKMI